MPSGNVGDMAHLVFLELLDHQGEGLSVLREEGCVGVATGLGLFERLGQEGNESIEVLFLGYKEYSEALVLFMLVAGHETG